jgi:hypothetical protein
MKLLMNSSVFILILFSFTATIYCQKTETVIYLSDGSVIRGQILEDSISNKIRILNHAGDIWSFDNENIDSVRSEKPFEYKAFKFNKRGSEFNLNGSLLIRSASNAIGSAVIPSLNIGYGYRFKPYLSAGVEAGIEIYEWMVIPFSAFIRLRSSGKVVAPFVFLRSGYTLPGEKREDDWNYSYIGKGGGHATIGIGVERILNESSSFVFSFAYHHQVLRYNLDPLNQWVQERDRTETYNRLRFGFGYVFK